MGLRLRISPHNLVKVLNLDKVGFGFSWFGFAVNLVKVLNLDKVGFEFWFRYDAISVNRKFGDVVFYFCAFQQMDLSDLRTQFYKITKKKILNY